MTHSEQPPKTRNHRAIPSPRRIHRECRRFRNLHLIKAGASILLDPHITSCPAIVLDQDQAIAIRDTLAQGLG